MSKPMITQKQADVIKTLYEDLRDDLSMSVDEFIDDHADGEGYMPLNDLNISVSLLAKYFYIGCEIISEFKVGDWLHNETSGITFKCIEVEENVVRADIPYQFAFNTEHGFVRHATPEEIAKEKEYRWWEEFDRLPWELKKGDVIYSKVTKSYYEVLNVFVDDSVNLEGTTPNEFNQYGVTTVPKEELNFHNFKVTCFVEDRKDV